MADIITSTSDPVTWQQLYDEWISERRPGWVVRAKKTYQVIQNINGEYEFHERTTQQLYDSTSFGS